MEPVMIVENPDGTNSVLAVHSNTSFQPNNVPTEDAGPAKAKSQPSSDAQGPLATNPFAELDASAATELQRMKKQDEVYLGQHAPAHEDFNRMLQEDHAAHVSHQTFVTYEATPHHDDRTLRQAVESADAALQARVAAYAAGPDPVLPRVPELLPTPGMDWLERMKAADEALQRSVDRADAALRTPSGSMGCK